MGTLLRGTCTAALALLNAGVADASEPTGAELAAAAVKAMGGAGAVAALETLTVTADCIGPGGPYTSAVHWRRDGSTLMSQSDSTGTRTLLAVNEEAWRLDETGGERTPLPAVMAEMVHGHAFHPTLFHLATRFHDHRAAGTGEDGCLRLEMLDEDERPVSVCLDPQTRLPLRYAFTPSGPGGEIVVEPSDWRRTGDLLYFYAFDLRQGDEEYRWDYTAIRPNAAGELFRGGDGSVIRQFFGPAWRPGERISLSLKDADLAHVLQSFARMGGFNMVLDPSVRGSVTVELKDVPWEQALQTILETHGLATEVDGAAWRVRGR